jgi:hypothetical protein
MRAAPDSEYGPTTPEVETIALRVSLIGGQRYAEDFTATWRDCDFNVVVSNRLGSDHRD